MITLKKNIIYLLGVFLNNAIDLAYLFHFKPKIKSSFPYQKLETEYKHTFFGYYDKSPFNKDDTKLLAIATNYDKKKNNSKEAVVGYFDLITSKFKEIGRTSTWSWQLGARLQWLPGEIKELICYNSEVQGNLGAIIQNISTKEIIRKFNIPIFDIDKKGNNALGLNFSRLYRMRQGYGYANFSDPTKNEKAPEDDGISLINLKNGEHKLLISTKFISEYRPNPSMSNATHYLNHISFSPCGNRFYFVHIWNKMGKRFSRGITCGIDRLDIHIIDKKENLSHYNWKSSEEILIHTSRKPNGVKFNLYKDRKNTKFQIGIGILNKSGHPSFSPNKTLIVTDTYPNLYRLQNLILCTSQGVLINNSTEIYSPTKYSNSENLGATYPLISAFESLV
mgnify:CR=1 FL=1